MTADEVAILAAQLTDLAAHVDRLEEEVEGVRTDVRALRDDTTTVRDLLIAERDADRRLRERCVDLVHQVVHAYTRPEGPSRGLTALTVLGAVTMLIAVGSLTVADLQPLVQWWHGDAPAPVIEQLVPTP